MTARFSFCIKATAMALSVFCSGIVHADMFTNITAFVRQNDKDNPNATIVIEKGTCKESWYPVRKAFDGIIGSADWDGNVMVVERPTAENPVIVKYSINADFSPGSRFVVTAFRFYSAYINPKRSIAKIRLEVSEDGMGGWCLLGENAFDVSLGDLKEKACTPFTVPIPASARRDARHYRFVITENLGYEGDPQNSQDPSLWLSEIELVGEIQEPRNLVWNGGEDGVWDGTMQNWNTEEGDVVSWMPRSSAVIGGSRVALSGEAEVSELVLGDALTPQTISGGVLSMRIPGRISARDGDVVSSAFSWGLVRTNTFECGDAYGFPPVNESDSKTGDEAVFFSGCRVSEITGVPEETDNFRAYFSVDENGYYPSYPMYFKIEDFGLSFQIHTKARRETYICAEKFVLRQDGDDVRGVACWSKFDNAAGVSEPYDFENLTASWAYLVLPKYGRIGYANNGVRNLRVSAEVSSALAVDCGGDAVFPSKNCLPRTEDKKTGTSATFIKDDVLAALGEFVGANGIYYAQDCGPAKPFFIVRAADRVTVQFQFPGPSHNHCIKVEFVQNGRNVDVRAVCAKSGSKTDVPIGTDFDDPSLGNKVWAGDLGRGDASGGINIRDIVVKRAGRVHLDGAFCGDRSVSVHQGVVELGAPELTLAQCFSGDGTLAFSPAFGSQTVLFNGYCDCEGGLELSGSTTVTVGRSNAFDSGLTVSLNGNGAAMVFAADTENTVGEVKFTGENTLTVENGARLVLTSVAFADDAVVNLVAVEQTGSQSVRIGSAKCLTKDELSRFRVNGLPVRRQSADGWLDLHRYGFGITIR